MRLFGRSPGAVYRVYGEDEYLEGDASADGRRDAPARLAPVDRGSGPRAAVLVGVGLLLLVATSAAVLVLEATAGHTPARAGTGGTATAGTLAASSGNQRPSVRRRSRVPPARAHRGQRSLTPTAAAGRARSHASWRSIAPASARPAPAVAFAAPAPSAVFAPPAASPVDYGAASGDSRSAREFGFER